MKITKEIADKIIAEIKATPKDELRKRYENTESILPDDFHMGCNCSEEISAIKARLAEFQSLGDRMANLMECSHTGFVGCKGKCKNCQAESAWRAARGEGEDAK